ncbi:lengsin-like [Littorina saxatilis]|uniref:Lengsin n=1 Tax=Littorina saxatilis TaxID=31220 RepID=A0AAN9GGK0_9CAEN
MAKALTLDEKKGAKGELDNLDYVYFAIPDINGIPRGQVIPRKFVKKKTEKGLDLSFATLYMGPNSEYVPDMDIYKNLKNGTWMADPSTLQVTPWSDHNSRTTGMVLCELTGEGVDEDADTRQLVKRLLDKLRDDFGLILKSAFEFEFSVYKMDDGTPLGSKHDQYLDLRSVQPDMDLLLELHEEMQQAGIDLTALASEMGAGQWEVNVEPSDGLAAADLAFHIKNAIKVFFRRRGYEATFMAVPQMGVCTILNMLHFNHSLWTPDGNNAMKDDVKDNAVSELALRWNAGLLRHGAAMKALCCPTVNCYRTYVYSDTCSARADWSVECRDTMIRCKVTNGNVYLESRLGSGPASPYLLMAAHLVAGMSGLQQEVTSPPPKDAEHAQVLPPSLDEALHALEKDDVMEEGLGKTFVSNYVTVKRHYEVIPYAKLSHESDAEKLEFERQKYFTTS